jgi:hypothetical protein
MEVTCYGKVDCPSPTYNENLIFPNPQKDLEEWFMNGKLKTSIGNEN